MMTEETQEPEFPHFSFRSFAFHILWIVVAFQTMCEREVTGPVHAFWLALIVLILLSIFGEVWKINNPDPRKKDVDKEEPA